MNCFERLRSCIKGDDIDFVPVAFWRHFPIVDQAGESLAQATLEWQKLFNFDFIKVMPSSSFCLKDWGYQDRYIDNPLGIRTGINTPIKKTDDWLRLYLLDPNFGSLGEQLHCLRIIVESINSKVPIVQTVFSPLLQMQKLIGAQEVFKVHMNDCPELVHEGLCRISESTVFFVKELLDIGIDGIFYVVRPPDFNQSNTFDYSIFGKPYDLNVLACVEDLWLNILHFHANCNNKTRVDEFLDYPVSVLNVHRLYDLTTLKKIHHAFKGAVCGGLKQEVMLEGRQEDIRKQSSRMIKNTASRRFILSTDCTLPIKTPKENIVAAIEAVRATR